MAESNEYASFGFNTRAIHAGQEYDKWSNSEMVPPIVTSMTYYQNNPAKMKGHFYSRVSNPTRESLEGCLASLDNAKHGLVYPSGCAAISGLLQLLKTGDHIVSCTEQYGGTRLLLLDYTNVHGIEMNFVDATNTELVEAAVKPNTRFILMETPSNPCTKIYDVAAIAKIAHSREGIIFAVDNTFLTPYFQQVLALGADIAMYSLTKYMNGHNDVLGGALILNNTEVYEKLKDRQSHYGSILPAFDCYLANRGLKTLGLRMEQHCKNGIAVAQYLQKHPKVVDVIHPALPTHPQYELAKKQSSGHCGIVTFQIKGELSEAKKFVLSLRIFKSSPSLGSFDSLAMIPVCVTHTSVPKDERESFGLFDSTVRLSVGLESINDLLNDLKQAFEKTFE